MENNFEGLSESPILDTTANGLWRRFVESKGFDGLETDSNGLLLAVSALFFGVTETLEYLSRTVSESAAQGEIKRL